ncbi:hypothetical protein SRHO_G00303580 [Serrasalmus rhombeus]
MCGVYRHPCSRSALPAEAQQNLHLLLLASHRCVQLGLCSDLHINNKHHGFVHLHSAGHFSWRDSESCGCGVVVCGRISPLQENHLQPAERSSLNRSDCRRLRAFGPSGLRFNPLISLSMSSSPLKLSSKGSSQNRILICFISKRFVFFITTFQTRCSSFSSWKLSESPMWT